MENFKRVPTADADIQITPGELPGESDIANPAGITCDGCGFINASRATLTTGTSLLTGGNLDGYRVQQGVITVSGAGLDARQSDYTDLIARAVVVNAGIWAQQLSVTAGANQVDSAHTLATPIVGSGAAPAVAIDVAAHPQRPEPKKRLRAKLFGGT